MQNVMRLPFPSFRWKTENAEVEIGNMEKMNERACVRWTMEYELKWEQTKAD